MCERASERVCLCVCSRNLSHTTHTHKINSLNQNFPTITIRTRTIIDIHTKRAHRTKKQQQPEYVTRQNDTFSEHEYEYAL